MPPPGPTADHVLFMFETPDTEAGGPSAHVWLPEVAQPAEGYPINFFVQ